MLWATYRLNLNVCLGLVRAIFSAKALAETTIRGTFLCRYVGPGPFQDCETVGITFVVGMFVSFGAALGRCRH